MWEPSPAVPPKMLLEQQAPPELSGLLSPSPAYFRCSGLAQALPSSANGDPPTLTSRGLRVRLNTVTLRGYGLVAVLDCYPIRRQQLLDNDGAQRYVMCRNFDYQKTDELGFAIRLRRLGDGQYARISSEQILVLPLPIPKGLMESEDGYNTVYVRQNPRYSPPDTLVRLGTSSDPYHYRAELVAAHPPTRFRPESMCLRSAHDKVGKTMGAFRFAVSSPLSTETVTLDVVLWLYLGPLGTWDCRTAQVTQSSESPDLPHIYETADARMRHGLGLPSVWSPSLTECRLSARGTVEMAYGRRFVILRLEFPTELSSPVVEHVHSLTSSNRLRLVHPRRIWSKELAKLTHKITISDSLALSVFPSAGQDGWNAVGTSRIRVLLGWGPRQQLHELLPRIDLEHLRTLEFDSGTLLHDGGYGATKTMVLWQRMDQDSVLPGTPLSVLNGVVVCDAPRVAGRWAELRGIPVIALRPVFWAAFRGRSLFAQHLLQEYGVDRNGSALDGLTLLHAAVIGRTAGPAGLLDEKLVRDSPDLACQTGPYGDTPAHFAAAYFRAGWSENTYNTFDRLMGPLFPPVSNPQAGEAPIWLMRNHAGETPLHRAAAMGQDIAMMWILDHVGRSEIDAKDNEGRTALWHAAAAGHTGIVRLLLNYHALGDEPDALGRTPLHAACIEGRDSVVRLLLGCDINPTQPTGPPGFTPAQLAALFGHKYCLSQLLTFPGAGDATDLPIPLIHLAAANGWLKCVRLICEKDYNPDTAAPFLMLIDPDAVFGRVWTLQRGSVSALETAMLCGQRKVFDYLQGISPTPT